jgi:ornithine cyclodeaminase/thiomorpholine-carboxylate dehydrogenase
MNGQTKSSSEIVKGEIKVLALSEAQVEELLDLNQMLGALSEGFKALARGEVQTPHRPNITVPDKGYVLFMPAFQKDMLIAIKNVSVFEGNLTRASALPSHLALINLFDPETGQPVCIMDGTYITAVRTSGSAVLSAKVLSRPDSKTATILGAGVQGRQHLNILPLVRDLDRIFICSLNYSDAERLARQNPKAVPVKDFEEAVRQSDIVCLSSHSYKPIIEDKWLKPGTHLSSVGVAPPLGELPVETAKNHSLFVETRDAFEKPPVGCSELGELDPASGTELGKVLLKEKPGRQSQEEITIYKAMGIAMEDMVVANLVYKRAKELGIGTEIVF